MFDVIDRHEWNGCAIGSLDEDLSRQGTLVHDFEVLGVLLAEDNVSKVDFGRFNLDKGLFAGANQRNIDSSSLAENREDRVDVLVELGREGDGDCGRQAGGHAARRRVLNDKEVLDLVFEWQQLERAEAERNVCHQDGLRVRYSHRKVLEDDLVWLGDKGSALELSASHDLRLNDSLFLANARLLHVLLLE